MAVFKRILSFVMVLVLLVGVVPVGALASEAEAAAETLAETTVETTEPAAQTTVPTLPETEPTLVTEAVETLPMTATQEAALAEEGSCGENASWSFDEATGTLTISGTGRIRNYVENVTCDPDSYTYKSYTHYYRPWQEHNDAITKIVVERGITMIGSGAFSDCGNLTSVSLPDTLGAIGMFAFRNCSNVRDIYIPRSVLSIYHCAFEGWGGATFHVYTESTAAYAAEELGFPIVYRDAPTPPEVPAVSGPCGLAAFWEFDAESGTLTISGNGAMTDFDPAPWYDHRDSIFQVVIEEGITHVGTFAFLECRSLTDIYFPKSLQTIGDYAFTDCKAPTCWVYRGSDAQYLIEELGLPMEFLDAAPEPDDTVIAQGEAGSLTWKLTKDGLLEIMGEGWMDFYHQNSPAPWTKYASQVTSLKISEGVEFLIKYKGCTADPVKLQNYHIRKDAQGFDGPVVEGRVYFDSFVLEARKAGIGVYKVG